MDFLRKCMVRAGVGALMGSLFVSTSGICEAPAITVNEAISLTTGVRKYIDKDAPGESHHYPMVISFSDDANPMDDHVPKETNSASSQSSSDGEILNVEEAAALLRVDRGVVVQLAAGAAIPARRVGSEWRFRRSALLAWVDGKESSQKLEPELHASIDDLPAAEMLENELRNVRGRGTDEQPHTAGQPSTGESRSEDGNDATADPSASAASTTSVGERPRTPTTEDIALRDQRVLLPRGSGTVDVGMAYGHSSQSLLPVMRVEQSQFYLDGTVRYGIMNNVQLTMRGPAVWSNTRSFVDPSATGVKVPTKVSLDQSMAQGASISVLGVGWRESVSRPTMIWSFDSTLPVGPGDRGVGGGMVLSKSYDPAVLFAGLTYMHGLRFDPADPQSVLGKNNYGVQFGYTYAVNDTLALSSALYGTYRDRSSDGTSIPPPRQNYSLQLGTTWMLSRGFFVEPAVAMGLGGDTPGLTLMLNFSRSFSPGRSHLSPEGRSASTQ